jgi:hypothetical protein
MRSRHRFTLLFFAALLAGCASKMPQTAVAQAGPSRAVQAVADNRAVLSELAPGLVMRLEIDGSTVQMLDPELVLVPRALPRTSDGDRVVVTGWRGNERVSSVTIADQRVNVQEGVGIVIRDRRSVSVALPTPRRIDRIEVTLPGLTTPQRFPVGDIYERACAQRTDSEFCR